MHKLFKAYLLGAACIAWGISAFAEAPEFAYKDQAKQEAQSLPQQNTTSIPDKPSEPSRVEENMPLPPPTGDNQMLRAQIKARESTQIASEMSGRINQLKIRDGEKFKAGQVLVGFHCSLEEAQLVKAKATLDKKRKTHEVNQKLEKLKSISVLQLDVSRAEENEAVADVNVGQAVLEKCVIRAPFSGKVVDVTARSHQSVRPGDPLMEIIKENDLEIEFMAPSKALPQLKPGSLFKVTLMETNKTYQAKIVRLGGKVDPVSQTIKVYGKITDNSSEVLPGMSGSIELSPP